MNYQIIFFHILLFSPLLSLLLLINPAIVTQSGLVHVVPQVITAANKNRLENLVHLTFSFSVR